MFIWESNGNGGYINSGFDGSTNLDCSLYTTGDDYYTGDYVNVYFYNGMGTMLGLNDASS